MQKEIIIKTPKQIANIRQSGKFLNELLYKLHQSAKPGVTLMDLENIAEDYMQKNHIKGAFKGYNGFPMNLCLSVNDCVVHGIPDHYRLKEGDVLKIDCGVIYEKGITDSAITMIVGGPQANPLGHQLAKITKESLDIGVKNVGPGKLIYEYSHAVGNYVTNQGFSVIQKLTGHGVGVQVHEKPYIFNYAHPDSKKITFEPGMVVAFEPITAITSKDFVSKPHSEWNLYCKQGDIGAHREYTVLITENGYEILSGITEFLH